MSIANALAADAIATAGTNRRPLGSALRSASLVRICHILLKIMWATLQNNPHLSFHFGIMLFWSFRHVPGGLLFLVDPKIH